MQTNSLFTPLLLVLVLLANAPGAPSPLALQVIHEFPSTPRTPVYGLVQASDGNLWGVASGTGPDNPCTVYKLGTNGLLSTIASLPFRVGGQAAASGPLLQATDGNFYGTAYGLVKANDFGSVYKLTPDGSLTTLWSFAPGPAGASPQGVLVEARDGSLYGATAGGATYGRGAVFKVSTKGVLTPVAPFTETNGAGPSAGLIQSKDGSFYGTTSAGGVNGLGVVFKLTPSGVLTALHSFGGSDGDSPDSVLVQGADGYLYGTTPYGGANPLSLGTVFKISTNGVFTLLHSFAGTDGASPQGLVAGGDGKFYGITSDGGANRWFGTLFRITTNGMLTTLRSFNQADGNYPTGALVGNSSTGFYGIMSGSEGNTSAMFYSVASAFKILTNGSLTTLHFFADPEGRTPGALTQTTNGEFYGTLAQGGTMELGAVYKASSRGVVSVLQSFKGTNGASPQGGLVVGIDGCFYGTTSSGGANDRGTVFRLTPGGTLTTLHSFNDADGSSPVAQLASGSDGLLYGTTYAGGRSSLGTIFKITTNGVLTTLASFNGTNGSFPSNPLVQGNDGSFYGAVSAGATGGSDNVFRITPGGTLTTLVSFNGLNGYDPRGLALGSDGNFYGITYAGGAAGQGTVFKMTPGGTLTSLVSFSGATGSHPQGSLLRGTDGNFYGSTTAAGAYGYGTVFMVTSDGVLTTLFSFDSTRPDTHNFLVQGQDGNLYGSFPAGTLGIGGTLFRLVTPPVITVFSGPNRSVVLNWPCFTNGIYRVEYKSTFAVNEAWAALTPDVTATAGTAMFTDNLEADQQRCYRVVLLP